MGSNPIVSATHPSKSLALKASGASCGDDAAFRAQSVFRSVMPARFPGSFRRLPPAIAQQLRGANVITVNIFS